MTEETNRMLTIRETAKLLGLSERTVRKMIAASTIPSWRPTGGRTVRIPLDGLLEVTRRPPESGT